MDEEKSVKICTVWFKKMVLAQHNYRVHHGVVKGASNIAPAEKSVINWT
jgi:hypothetical protein